MMNQVIKQLIGKVRIVPVPYDLTTCYHPGTRFAPAAILGSMSQLELFDEELEWDPSQYVRFTEEEAIPPNAKGPQAMKEAIFHCVSDLLESEEFILTLGGEHSITAAVIDAYLQRYPKLHVVQIDAHCDLRDTWDGTPHSHACVMRRIVEKGLPLTQIGIRNISEEEHHFLKEHPELAISVWKAQELKKEEIWEQLRDTLKETIQDPIYLTIDLDGLDPSVIPAVGTPEPGGLSWYETLKILKTLCFNNQIVGADVVELSPLLGAPYATFAAAKLCYKLVSYVFYSQWKASQE
ncbi:agmatinase [Deltaproteobacteria bacterium TL4]